MKLGADAYRLRDISFELMLLTRGFVHFDFSDLDIDHPIYQYTVTGFLSTIKVKLVELAIHQRNLDDEFKNLVSDTSHAFHNDRSIMDTAFVKQEYAFDRISTCVLTSLREVSNKIIHVDKFVLAGAFEDAITQAELTKIGEPDLARVVMLHGKKGKSDWCVLFDLLVYCEQCYLFGEILAEQYGI
ncbi:hypothetical protein MSP8886_03224 [Marinomonas spartinae]|uniref:Uncharacterized protein n=1 Tax=Marinomonas spartinae TaxID=1792290 RepID=A0A1A8TM01_9GAMM|nr:hypothetical protein [Marinomonas spartinae]SBS34989.1 hypothetical protein MSP8886_03224 [Marinomonas spartinae]